jgi:hypothetical protein
MTELLAGEMVVRTDDSSWRRVSRARGAVFVVGVVVPNPTTNTGLVVTLQVTRLLWNRRSERGGKLALRGCVRTTRAAAAIEEAEISRLNRPQRFQKCD